MHAITLKVDDSIYADFLSFLEILPKDKAQIIEDDFLYEPNSETIEAMRDARDEKNLSTYKSVDEMFLKLSSKNA